MPSLLSLPIKKFLLEALQSEGRTKRRDIHHHTWKDGFLVANLIKRETRE